MTFDTVRENYIKGLWTKEMVKLTIIKGVITPEQYTEITGESY